MLKKIKANKIKMPNKNKPQKDKTIFILKKEHIFPDWGVFRKVNEIIWGIVLKKILKEIKKSKNYVVITDCENKIELKKYGIKSKIFGDYIKTYQSKYPSSIKLSRKFFKSNYFKKIKNYNQIDLGLTLEEEFSYFLMNIIDYLEIIDLIVKKENPKKIITLTNSGFFNEITRSFAEQKGIKRKVLLKNKRLNNFINNLTKKFSFWTRFHKFPKINRREFIKTKKRIKKSDSENIMLLGLDNTYFNRLGNIPDELKKNKKKFFSLCTNLDTQKQLKNKGINFFSFGDFLDQNIKDKIKKRKKFLSEYWGKIKKEKKFQEIFTHNSINFFNVLEKDIRFLIKTKIPWIMYYLETSNKLFNSQKVKYIVGIDNAIAVTRGIIQLAKSKKIPTLVIQNGIIYEKTGMGYIPLIADKMAVWGKISKEHLTNQGINPKKIVITGCPFFDKLEKINIKDDSYKKFGLDKNKKIIILATQAFGDLFSNKEFSNLAYVLIKILKNFPDRQLVIKIHPREKAEMYEKIIQETKAKNAYIIREDIEELINMCEALITIDSTVALQTLLINKPVIITNFLKRYSGFPYVESGATIKANNEKELIKVLKNLEKAKPNEKIIKKFLDGCDYKQDGKAGKRIVKLIKKMV